jgi:asparagine synthase (glutamine-hydrolysing)
VDVDHPQQQLIDVHRPYAGDSLVNQMLGIDLKFILADGDLPKVTHMCELADIDVGFPLLDDRIVEFSQRLSAQHKLRGRTLRWFFKHALRDFLPPAVITKQKHGFGLPVGAWLVSHRPLLDLAADGIGKLRGRGIVQPKLIDGLLTVRLREHPAYFGTMVWVLMMLGLWLDSRRL